MSENKFSLVTGIKQAVIVKVDGNGKPVKDTEGLFKDGYIVLDNPESGGIKSADISGLSGDVQDVYAGDEVVAKLKGVESPQMELNFLGLRNEIRSALLNEKEIADGVTIGSKASDELQYFAVAVSALDTNGLLNTFFLPKATITKDSLSYKTSEASANVTDDLYTANGVASAAAEGGSNGFVGDGKWSQEEVGPKLVELLEGTLAGTRSAPKTAPKTTTK